MQSAAIGAAAAAAAACAPVPAPPTPTTPAPPVPPDWAALRGRLSGPMFLPSDAGYDTARLAFNPLFDGHHPAAVVQSATPSDVQACVGTAAASRVPIAARSGGHSYVGYSTPERGIVVDMGRMNSVTVAADGTAVIGAGARLLDVYMALADAGRCLPGGSCPTVGIAGLTLGGGIGVLTTKYGLTSDNLIAAEIVTADGQLRTVSASQDPDLFWALRGGGGGNFGLVTSFTFRTVPTPPLTVFQLVFPAGSAADVFGGWQTTTAAAPDELWSTMGLTAGSPPTCRVTGCFVGQSGALDPLVDALVAATGARPTSRYVAAKGYLDAMLWFGGCANYTPQQCRPSWTGAGRLERESFVATSRIITKPLADPSSFTATITGRQGMDVLVDSIGGAAGRVGATETPFPHRGALASVQIYAAATPETAAAVTQEVGEVRAALGELLGPHGYINHIDPAMPDWARAYYGPNLQRLQEVAKRYDPHQVFAFAQGIA